MKTYLTFFGLLLMSAVAFCQNDKTVVGKFCYYEQIDGQKSNSEAIPYIYHSRLELKFKSGYDISVLDIPELRRIIKLYASKTTSSKVLLGEYKPEAIGKGNKVADLKSTLKIYWNGKTIALEIPQLLDMFGEATAPNHIIFLPKECISGFLDCLKQ